MIALKVRIRTIRESLGLTQAELAKKLNVAQRSVERWEQGVREPRAKYLYHLWLLEKTN